MRRYTSPLTYQSSVTRQPCISLQNRNVYPVTSSPTVTYHTRPRQPIRYYHPVYLAIHHSIPTVTSPTRQPLYLHPLHNNQPLCSSATCHHPHDHLSPAIQTVTLHPLRSPTHPWIMHPTLSASALHLTDRYTNSSVPYRHYSDLTAMFHQQYTSHDTFHNSPTSYTSHRPAAGQHPLHTSPPVTLAPSLRITTDYPLLPNTTYR